VVDDCPDTCSMMNILLSLWGHEVRTAADGRAALELFRAFRPDIIFLDLGLPIMDGYEVARRIRRSEGEARCVIVCVSGFATESHRRRSLDAGCDAHWVKPVKPEMIRELLSAMQATKVVSGQQV
jgi:CheY-like chemotaxis protein